MKSPLLRITLVIWLWILLWVVCTGPAAADFCLLTQNGLHLGQGLASALAVKRQHYRRIFAAYDVVVLQEVMDDGEPARLAPDGFAVAVSAAKGAGRYQERYAVLIRQDVVRVLDQADYDDDMGAFSRPPFAVALEDQQGGRFWLVDFHALFGQGGLAPRRREVAAMADVVAHFAARPLPDGSTIARVMVAGDWNLSGHDRSFDDLARLVGISVAPDLPTSLNRQGEFVSAYDHFVWNADRMGLVLAPEPRDLGGLDGASYRRQLSDHAGVAAWVQANPAAQGPAERACPPQR